MSEANDRPMQILSALGVDSVVSVAPVTGGADTEIWRVEHDGLVSALRVMRSEQKPIAKIERIAMEAASAVLPVPQIRASTIWNEQPAMLIEWMPGVPLLHLAIEDVHHASDWGRLLGDAQARLHEIAAPTGLPTAAESWMGGLNPELPATTHGDQLLHFDFHPMNLLVDNGAVSGVIDWTNAATGDPRLDAARTWSIFETVPITFPNLDAEGSRFVVSEFSRGWREAYEARRGPLGDIEPFLQWALIATTRDFGKSTPGKASKSDVISNIVDGVKGVVDPFDTFR